jgi:PEP-CTERM motif
MPHPPGPDELSCIPTTVSDSGSPNALPPGALPCPTQPAGSEPVAQLADSDDPANNNPSEDEPQQSSPGNVPGARSEAPESQLPPESEAGAPMPPLQDEPPQIVLLEPSPDNVGPSEAPESEFPTGLDDPLNPPTPLPLRTAPYDGPQIAELSPAAVPEPSMIGLMLLGLAALSWTGRRRLTPKRRA